MKRSRMVGIAAGVLVAMQLVPLSRTNPPVEGALAAPPEVQAILDRSCMDCHSHATRWPWYAWAAPVSWLVVYDVHHGRDHVNFSRWSSYSAKQQRHKLDEMVEMVEDGEMPLTPYLWLHREAELSQADRELLVSFAETRTPVRESDEEPAASPHEDHEHQHQH